MASEEIVDQLQGYFRFGLKGNLRRNPNRLAAGRISSPGLGQKEAIG